MDQVQSLDSEGLHEYRPPASPPRPSHWLIGIAEAAGEIDLCRRLQDIGVHAYLPIVVKQRRAGRNRLRDVVLPLLRPYFFVPASISFGQYHDILSTRGVADFLCINRKPAALKDHELERIRYHEARFEQLRLKRIAESGKGARWAIGEEVKIAVGFAILDAIVDAVDTKHVKVKLREGTLFGRDVVEVDLAHIHPAG